MIWLPVLTMLDPSFASASRYGGSDEHLDFAFSLRLIGELSELGVTLFAREELFYLAADLREWRGAGRPASVDLDDVKAEGGFDDAADGARLEGESSGFERRFACKALFDLGQTRIQLRVGHVELSRARFLHEHVEVDELIQKPAQDLVALVGGNLATRAALESVDRVLELPSFDGFAVDLCD